MAALAAVTVGATSLFGLAAYRGPVVHAVMMASTASPPAQDVPTTVAPVEESSTLDLDVLLRTTERAESVPSAAVEVDATEGVLVLPRAAEGHRVWVDGHLIEVVSSRTPLACGRHVVKIGSRGRAQEVVVPCGADLFVPYP